MNSRKILFPSLLVGSLLALALRLFARLFASQAVAKPAPKDRLPG